MNLVRYEWARLTDLIIVQSSLSHLYVHVTIVYDLSQ